MTRETGRVVAVTTSLAGDELAVAAASGATTIFVVDAADFDEAGGLLQVTHDVPTELDPVNAPGVLTNVLTAVTYTYTAVDDGTGAITLADPLIAAALEGDRVTILDPQTQAPAQEVTAMVALSGFDNDDALEATVGHALSVHLPEGIREDGAGEVVAVEWRNDELQVTDVLDQAPGLNSDAGGWSLDDAGASFSDLQVYGTVGADTLTANAIEVGGKDLDTEVLAAMPKGLIVHAAPITGGSGTNTGSNAAETSVFRVNVGTLYADRFYRVTYSGSFTGASAVAGDVYQTVIRYTTDGSTPTVTAGSAIMNKSLARHPVPVGGQVTTFYKSWFYTPSADYDNVRFAFTTQRLVGTGFPVIKNDDFAYGFYIAVEDMGLQTNVGGSLVQVSPLITAPEDATYTTSWTANWARLFTAAGDYSGDGFISQGYQSGYKTQVGFNDADIRAKLSGATIKKITLTYRVQSSATGLPTVIVGTHGNSTAPASWSGASSSIVSQEASAMGATTTVTLPVSVGNAFKSGTTRGVTFGPVPTTAEKYNAAIYATGTNSAPKLTITYSK